MAIDDNHRSRENVLTRVRAALGRRAPEEAARNAARAYIAAHAQGPRPVVSGDLVDAFLTRAADMESTVARVPTLDDVAAAVG
ncbi:MAG TPA: lactate utilization protein C, partial [Casimicrobiaceae bacterium]|nr:lactate utilization protein C [Casimicrobiaceae bacterium]